MSNRGVFPGVSPDGWRFFETDIQGSHSPGHAEVTKPSQGNSTYIGRYYKFSAGLVICQLYFNFGSTFVPGTNENYIVKLPFPANRWSSALSNATADIPIGMGIVTEGTADNTIFTTTVAAGSNGVNTNTFLGGGTLNVPSTSGATQNGIINVATGGTTASIRYSGLTATTFTGCNTESGGGAMSTGGAISGTFGISKELPIVPTLADPLAPLAQQTQEDYWAHMFIQHSKNTGSGTIANATQSTTIIHNLGLTPKASDIQVTPTGNPTTNPKLVSVQNITSTSFDVYAGTSLTTGTLPFEWKAMVEPNSSLSFPQLVNYQRPWTWGPGHTLSLQMTYEARF